jgi:basic membrane protein A
MPSKEIAMRRLLVLGLTALTCIVFGVAGTAGAKKFKVAMVTDVGGVNDQSFNQSAWEGLKRAKKELGIQIAYKESRQDADYAPNMETFTDAEFDLIWGIGFLMGDAIKSTARINPDQKYAIIDFAYGPQTPKNVGCAVFQEEQPSFLVGYIAGKMTKTNKVGFVGGIKFPLIEKFDFGNLFRAAVFKGVHLESTDHPDPCPNPDGKIRCPAPGATGSPSCRPWRDTGLTVLPSP